MSSSKGFAEITVSDAWGHHPRVQFIHETVRDYLRETGVCRLEGSISENPIGISNDILKSRCVEYLSFVAQNLHLLERLLGLLSGELDPSIRRYIHTEFPFLDYALRRAVMHAEIAQAHGVSQVAFLEAFPLDLLINISRCEENEMYEYSPYTTKPYIFALLDAPELLQLELSNIDGGNELRPQVSIDADSVASSDTAHPAHQGHLGAPPIAAVWTESIDTVRLLLQHGSDPNVLGGPYHNALVTALFNKESYDMFKSLLRHGADANAPGLHNDGTTVLHHAVERGNLQVVRLLVRHGADINAGGGQCATVLQTARGNTGGGRSEADKVFQFLVEQGAHNEKSDVCSECLRVGKHRLWCRFYTLPSLR